MSILQLLPDLVLTTRPANSGKSATTFSAGVKIITLSVVPAVLFNQLDVIFEWMVQNTNAWRVVATPDNRRFVFVVVFAHSPFHPEEWDNCEDYKYVMLQMFGEFGEYKAEGFFTSRSTVEESDRIFRDFINIGRQIKLYDYVTFDFDGVRTLGMVIDGGILNEIHTVKILSGGSCGRYCTVGEGDNVSKIEPGEAMRELARQKEEWKNKK